MSNSITLGSGKSYLTSEGGPLPPTNCPNCGAPIDLHAEACAYCGTFYATLGVVTGVDLSHGPDFTVTTIEISPAEIAAATEALERGFITPKEARRYFAP